jgi:hypothetical protein
VDLTATIEFRAHAEQSGDGVLPFAVTIIHEGASARTLTPRAQRERMRLECCELRTAERSSAERLR